MYALDFDDERRVQSSEPMPFEYRRRKSLGKHFTLNTSKSGASLTGRFRPLKINSLGSITLRIAKGLTFRF